MERHVSSFQKVKNCEKCGKPIAKGDIYYKSSSGHKWYCEQCFSTLFFDSPLSDRQADMACKAVGWEEA